jgi:hypothetical protein
LEEWHILQQTSKILPVIGVIALFVALLRLIFNENRRKNYFSFAFTILSFLATLSHIFLQPYSFEDGHCRNDVERLNYRDGFTLCNLQSFMLCYSFLGISFTWCLQAFEICRNVFTTKSNFSNGFYRRNYLLIIYGLPFLFIGLMIKNKLYGGTPMNYSCLVNGRMNDDLRIFYIPMLFAMILGTIFFAALGIKVILLLRETKVTSARSGPNLSPQPSSSRSFRSSRRQIESNNSNMSSSSPDNDDNRLYKVNSKNIRVILWASRVPIMLLLSFLIILSSALSERFLIYFIDQS